jgi:hypothetical protein
VRVAARWVRAASSRSSSEISDLRHQITGRVHRDG